MPILDNQRHELFAHGLAKGKTAEEAYRAAGYKPSRQHAHRLATKGYVVARVTQLQGMVAESVVIDRAWVIARLTENVERALQRTAVIVDGKPSGEYRYDGSVANKALELLGKEVGMFVDRSENTNHNYTISDQPLTDDEWAGEYAQQH